MLHKKVSVALIVGILLAWCGIASAAIVDVYNFAKYGGTWNDVNKTGANQDDDYMCWAATDANTLAWLGWTPNSSLDTAPEIWNYYLDHWADYGGWAYWGWQWWFDGTHFDMVEGQGGAFYTPPYTWSDFYHEYTGQQYNVVMNSIKEYTDKGYGMSLWVYGPSSHAITCWGYKMDGSAITGVWITDSDDGEGSQQLLYFDVEDNGGPAVLPTYRGGGYQLRAVYALDEPVTYWNGGTGSFHTAANWSHSYLPDTLLDARIDGGTAQISQNATVDKVYVGFWGTGVVTQAQGAFTAAEFHIGDMSGGNGRYEIGGGTLNVMNLYVGSAVSTMAGTATFSVTNNAAAINISKLFLLGLGDANYSAVAGTTLTFANDTAFKNASQVSSKVGGLAETTFLFNGTGPASTNFFEIAGQDLGAVVEGFTNNFHIKALTIGGSGVATVKLVNEYLNYNGTPPGSYAEGLYIHTLTVNSGSTFDLSNFHVYAGTFNNYGTILNGSVTVMQGGLGNGPETIPEPTVLAMILPALLGIGAVIRRRR
jgi:hypothetical protein